MPTLPGTSAHGTIISTGHQGDKNEPDSLSEVRAPQNCKRKTIDAQPAGVQPLRSVKRTRLNLKQDEDSQSISGASQPTNHMEKHIPTTDEGASVTTAAMDVDSLPVNKSAQTASSTLKTGRRVGRSGAPKKKGAKERKKKQPRQSKIARTPPTASPSDLKLKTPLKQAQSVQASSCAELNCQPRLWTSTRKELALFTWFTEKHTQVIIGNGDSTGTSVLFDESGWFHDLALIGTDIFFSISSDAGNSISRPMEKHSASARLPTPPSSRPTSASTRPPLTSSIMLQKGKRSKPRQSIMKQVGKRTGPPPSSFGKQLPSLSLSRAVPSTPPKSMLPPPSISERKAVPPFLDIHKLELRYPTPTPSPTPLSVRIRSRSNSIRSSVLASDALLIDAQLEYPSDEGARPSEAEQNTITPLNSSVGSSNSNPRWQGAISTDSSISALSPFSNYIFSPSNTASLSSTVTASSWRTPTSIFLNSGSNVSPLAGSVSTNEAFTGLFYRPDGHAYPLVDHQPYFPSQRAQCPTPQSSPSVPALSLPFSPNDTSPLAITREDTPDALCRHSTEPRKGKDAPKGPFSLGAFNIPPTPPASTNDTRRPTPTLPDPVTKPVEQTIPAEATQPDVDMTDSRPDAQSPPDLPNKVEEILKTYASGASINAFFTREALIRADRTLSLPEEYGFVWMGRFKITYIKELIDQDSSRVTWKFKFAWSQDGEELIPTDGQQTSLPWWRSQACAPSSSTDESSDRFLRLKAATCSVDDNVPFFVIDCLNPLGTGRKDTYYSKGWICVFCGRMNEETMMRHRQCTGSQCKKSPIPPGYARSIEELRGVGETLPVLLPNVVDSDGTLDSMASSWSDDMLTVRYTGRRNGSLDFSFIFGGNRQSLQEEASRLFVSLQKDVILLRENSSPYFVSIVEPEEWEIRTGILTQAKQYVLDRVWTYAEMPTFDFNQLKVLGWLASSSCSSPGHPWTVDATEHQVVVACLGAEATLQITLPSVAFNSPANNDQLSNDEDQRVDNAPEADTPSTESQGARPRGKLADCPTVTLTMYHGDVLVFSGVIYKIAVQRIGTTLLLLGSQK